MPGILNGGAKWISPPSTEHDPRARKRLVPLPCPPSWPPWPRSRDSAGRRCAGWVCSSTSSVGTQLKLRLVCFWAFGRPSWRSGGVGDLRETTPRRECKSWRASETSRKTRSCHVLRMSHMSKMRSQIDKKDNQTEPFFTCFVMVNSHECVLTALTCPCGWCLSCFLPPCQLGTGPNPGSGWTAPRWTFRTGRMRSPTTWGATRIAG